MTSNAEATRQIRYAYANYLDDPNFAGANYTTKTVIENEDFVTDPEIMDIIDTIRKMVPSDYNDIFSVYLDAIDYIIFDLLCSWVVGFIAYELGYAFILWGKTEPTIHTPGINYVMFGIFVVFWLVSFVILELKG